MFSLLLLIVVFYMMRYVSVEDGRVYYYSPLPAMVADTSGLFIIDSVTVYRAPELSTEFLRCFGA